MARGNASDEIIRQQAQILVLRIVGAQIDHVARGDGGERCAIRMAGCFSHHMVEHGIGELGRNRESHRQPDAHPQRGNRGGCSVW